MSVHVLLCAVPFFLSTILVAGLLYQTRHKRQQRTARYFRAVMVLAFCWSLSSSIYLFISSDSLRLFWIDFKYIFVVFIPVAWLMLAMVYSGFERLTTRRVALLLSVLPVTTLLLVATNSLHHLIFRSSSLYNADGIVTIVRTYGPWFQVHTGYSYLMIGTGLGLFIRQVVIGRDKHRRQAAVMVFGALIPFFYNVVFVLSPGLSHNLDYTPVAFAGSGVLFAVGLFRYGLLNIIPVARAEIVRGMQDPVVVLDNDDRIIDLNRATIQRFGIFDGDYSGMPLSEVLPRLDHLSRRIRNSKHAREEILLVEPGGNVWFDCSIQEFASSSGRRRGCILVLREITEMKRVEVELREAKERAEESSRLKSAFLSNMSHEIRTPLSGVIGMAGILAKETDGEHAEFAQMIESGARRLLETLESIIDVSLLAAGDVELAIETVDLCVLCQTATGMFENSAREKNLSLIARPDSEPVECAIDPNHMSRIISHLLENAMKFTPAGRVTMTVGREQNRAVLSIEDTGIGIEPDILPHIYEAFTQAEYGSNRQAEGTGLGLHLVKGLVEEMGGTIRIDSTIGKGTTCRVTFPLAEPEQKPRAPGKTVRFASGVSSG